jgi:hypothetical protein
MKVTALIPEDVLKEVKRYSGGKNVTESLMIALTGYLNQQRLRRAVKKVKEKPLRFSRDYSAARVRKANRLR